MESNGKLIMALLAGAAAGVIVGLLLAPEKGSDTRTKLADSAKKLADTILTKAEEAIDKAASNTSKS